MENLSKISVDINVIDKLTSKNQLLSLKKGTYYIHNIISDEKIFYNIPLHERRYCLLEVLKPTIDSFFRLLTFSETVKEYLCFINSNGTIIGFS